jgi:hypothetical protein
MSTKAIQAASGNGAITLSFHVERSRRAVPEQQCSSNYQRK